MVLCLICANKYLLTNNDWLDICHILYLGYCFYNKFLDCLFTISLGLSLFVSLILPVCIIIDYFIFRRTFNLARPLIDTTKELKELEKWNEQI